jgi:hypothetical protein
MVEPFEYFQNKRTDRTYISKQIKVAEGNDTRTGRIISKVIDPAELHKFIKVKDEVILYVTPGEREEIKAFFYEDHQEISTLTIQRYTKKNGNPHNVYFTFAGDAIDKLYNLIRSIKLLKLPKDSKVTFDDNILEDLLIHTDDKKKFLRDNEDLVIELVKNDLSKADVIALAYRKEQLDIFHNLLTDEMFFKTEKGKLQKSKDEDVWQWFFETNPWIFGYGLNYIFTSRLDDKKLEQVVSGYSVNQRGKRVDALMKTRGLISSLCFVEIKTHKTLLIDHSKHYRPECWRTSNELAGSISQIQKTTQKAIQDIKTKLETVDNKGLPTGETLFLYQPKSFLVIGSLSEFIEDSKTNEQKFSSFELYRRNVNNPEIITFDELYERAKYIVKHAEEEK